MVRSILLITLFVAVIFVPVTHAQEPSKAAEEIIETDTPIGVETIATESASTTAARIDYELPYPGMLPDNPLYILKVIRDGIVKLLINEPIKRARFSLESSEKRMYASKLLVQKGKDKLAVETIGKGNNYLEDSLKAVQAMEEESSLNTDVKPFLIQFKSSVSKQLEIAEDLNNSIDNDFNSQFEIQKNRLKNFIKIADAKLKSS